MRLVLWSLQMKKQVQRGYVACSRSHSSQGRVHVFDMSASRIHSPPVPWPHGALSWSGGQEKTEHSSRLYHTLKTVGRDFRGRSAPCGWGLCEKPSWSRWEMSLGWSAGVRGQDSSKKYYNRKEWGYSWAFRRACRKKSPLRFVTARTAGAGQICGPAGWKTQLKSPPERRIGISRKGTPNWNELENPLTSK